jgi:hypothetical protein
MRNIGIIVVFVIELVTPALAQRAEIEGRYRRASDRGAGRSSASRGG